MTSTCCGAFAVLSLLAAVAAQPPAAPAAPPPPPIPQDLEPVTTASGLQYSVLAPGGEGPAPRLGDKVRVHYTAWLTDGTVFDSSRHGEPAEFALGQVIDGWNEGLQLMTPGARFKLTLPPKLGYGEDGSPPVIPANATLIFDLELLAVTRAPEFRAPKAEAAKSASGLRYEVLAPGEGEAPQPDEPVQLEFSLWNTAGKLIHSTRTSSDSAHGSAASMRWKVLAESIGMLKPGGSVVCDAPASLTFGDETVSPDLEKGANSIWLVELKRVFRKPAFELPAEDTLTKTASGLQYRVLHAGAGTTPTMGMPITVHYAGWLTDGTPFDSSYEHGTPATFRLGEVIQGWNEGLQLMQPGAAYVFVIPPDLGYGARGSPPKIGADATLVFHIELLKAGR